MARCLTLPVFCKEQEQTFSESAQAVISVESFSRVAEIDRELWEGIVPKSEAFFNLDYLVAIENSVDGGNVDFRYLIYSRNGAPIAAAVFQIVQFKGSNVENEPLDGKQTLSAYFSKTIRSLTVSLVNRLSLNLLVCGNCFVTGDYGIYLKDEHDSDNMMKLLDEGINKIISDSEKSISGLLIKDFYSNKLDQLTPLAQQGFLQFEVNPNMILEVEPSWNTFDDYLDDMVSKYRTRMKRALKKCDEVDVVNMDEEELQAQMPRISDLYDQVIDESAFKLTKLHIDYLLNLKRSLKDFQVIGFYKNNKLVAFISYYLDRNDLVAGFMGMEYELNKEHDLYLNVLLKLIEEGIRLKVHKVIFGRTAMEIKSSVGAKPHSMYLFTRHRNPLINRIIHAVVKSLAKDPEWTLRRPFKKDRES